MCAWPWPGHRWAQGLLTRESVQRRNARTGVGRRRTAASDRALRQHHIVVVATSPGRSLSCRLSVNGDSRRHQWHISSRCSAGCTPSSGRRYVEFRILSVRVRAQRRLDPLCCSSNVVFQFLATPLVLLTLCACYDQAMNGRKSAHRLVQAAVDTGHRAVGAGLGRVLIVA